MVAAALLVGAVLAVASAPVGAVLLELMHLQPLRHEYLVHRRDGHLIVGVRLEYRTVTILGANSEPEPGGATNLEIAARPNARTVGEDFRTRHLRAPLDGQVRTRVWIGAGWPLRSAYAVGGTDPGAFSKWYFGDWRRSALGRDFLVPYLPHWPGLLGNTLFYAALALGLLVLLRWRRTGRRRARGLCVACGYELGEGVGVCPECGLSISTGTPEHM